MHIRRGDFAQQCFGDKPCRTGTEKFAQAVQDVKRQLAEERGFAVASVFIASGKFLLVLSFLGVVVRVKVPAAGFPPECRVQPHQGNQPAHISYCPLLTAVWALLLGGNNWHSLTNFYPFALPILDEHDPAFWDEVKGLGWKFFNHTAERTLERYNEWYPPLIDTVALSLGIGFVGTMDSTFSTLSAKRVEDWNDGFSRLVHRHL